MTARLSRDQLLRRGAVGGGALVLSGSVVAALAGGSGGNHSGRRSGVSPAPDRRRVARRRLPDAGTGERQAEPPRPRPSGRWPRTRRPTTQGSPSSSRPPARCRRPRTTSTSSIRGAPSPRASILKLAAQLETLVLGAYLGAIENVQTPELRLPIGQIAANEAQHVGAVGSRRPERRSSVAPSPRRSRSTRPRPRWTRSRAECRSSSTRRARPRRRSASASTRCAAGTRPAASGSTRDASNRRVVAGRGDRPPARRRRAARTSAPATASTAIVTDVKIDGLMAQVEMVVSEPVRLVAIVTRDAVEELGLKNGHGRDRDREVDQRDDPELAKGARRASTDRVSPRRVVLARLALAPPSRASAGELRTRRSRSTRPRR